jgi:hypothetical protein
MQYLLIFNESILPIFIIALIAFVFKKISRPDIRQVANPALQVFVPILVFDSLTRFDFAISRLLQPFAFMVLLTAALIALAALAAGMLRLEPGERISLILAVSMINIGNFGLPLIYFTYGQQAEAYSVIIFIIFNIPLSTVAIYLSSDKTRLKDILADISRIPIFHAFLAALIFCHFNWSLPEGLAKGVHLLAQGAIPLIIFVLGLQLADISLKGRLREFVLAIAAAVCLRLLVSPAIAEAILSWLPMTELEHKVALVQTSGPSALLPLMFAIRFNRSPDLLAAIILLTTLLSGLTLPAIIQML